MHKRKSIYPITIFLYFFLNLLLLTRHEAWRDEAQAWTIARNLSIGEILDILPTEGHLLPFFVILKIWNKLGGAFAGIGLISLTIMTISVALFLCKAPFPTWVKRLIIISPIFFYYNAVIARCYALVVLALILVAITRNKLEKNMLAYCLSVAFLTQTHVLVLPLALALCVELLIYNLARITSKKQVVMTAIPAFSILASFLELYQKKKTAFITFDTIHNNINNAGFGLIRERLKTIITKVYAEGRIYSIVVFLIVASIVIISCLLLLKTNKIIKLLWPELVVCSMGLLGYIAIIGIVRPCAHIQMALVFYMLLLFAAWIITDARNKKAQEATQYLNDPVNYDRVARISLSFILVLFVVLSYRKELLEIKYDYFNNYSNSKTFATEAIKIIPSDSEIFVRQEDYKISAPYAYITDKRTDIVFWDVDKDAEFKCITWGKEYPEKDMEIIIKKQIQNAYYLTSEKTEIIGRPVLIAEEPNPWGENYYLYSLKK